MRDPTARSHHPRWELLSLVRTVLPARLVSTSSAGPRPQNQYVLVDVWARELRSSRRVDRRPRAVRSWACRWSHSGHSAGWNEADFRGPKPLNGRFSQFSLPMRAILSKKNGTSKRSGRAPGRPPAMAGPPARRRYRIVTSALWFRSSRSRSAAPSFDVRSDFYSALPVAQD